MAEEHSGPAASLKPATAEQVVEIIRWAAAEESPLEIVGGGSKRALGRPVEGTRPLDLSALSGIRLYEPEELVMAADPGTSLAEIEATLAARRQMLAFEPPDWTRLLSQAPAGRRQDDQPPAGRRSTDQPAAGATIGGVFAANQAGPRRLKAGAARDHLLGFHAVSGRGEAFKAGGRVVKNVTGYDVAKLMTGAWGTLGAFTQLTFKVLPAPETAATVLVFGLDDGAAVRAMAAALRAPFEVSGAAHLPAGPAGRSAVSGVRAAGAPVTAIRLEGVAPSVDYRATRMAERLGALGLPDGASVTRLDRGESMALWRDIRDVGPFAGDDRAVWKVSVAPGDGPAVAAVLAGRDGAEHFFDWGGGLVWIAVPAAGDAGAAVLRAAVAERGGHATLIRAPEPLRAAVPVFPPLSPALAALTRRVKDGFDPRRVLNPGRMYAGV